MARKTRERFAQIIEREFRKALEIKSTASVVVDMSEDEVIRVLYGNEIYECDCDNDQEFRFASNYNVVAFSIPADYLEDRLQSRASANPLEPKRVRQAALR
jgi:hypothetical protein